MGVIEEIKAGNKETIKQVYKENVKDVYNFAKSITGNHESALDATKKTFVILFGRIQKGQEPSNIRLAALKIAYDEACAIAMPSTDAVDSPFDKDKLEDEDITFKVNDEEKAAPSDEAFAGESAEDEITEDLHDDLPENEVIEEAAPESLAHDDPVSENETVQTPDQMPEDVSGSDEDLNISDDLFEDLTREDTLEDNYEDEDFSFENTDDESEYETRKKHPVLSKILIVINIILVLILIWFLLGLLQNLGIIPESISMGHEWFNEVIYPLF